MKLFELLPCVDLPGRRSLTIAPPIDLLVKQALARLERRPSRQWLDAVRDLETGGPVRLEVSLEELALLLERVDFSSSRLEDIEAMKFWSHLEASCELLEALGHEWSNHLGFDCHESFSLVWCVPEGMVGYLAWLARCARPVPTLPEELRYLNPRSKLSEVAARLLNTLAAHVNATIRGLVALTRHSPTAPPSLSGTVTLPLVNLPVEMPGGRPGADQVRSSTDLRGDV